MAGSFVIWQSETLSLCRCRVERKRGSIGSRMKHWQISLAIIAALSASLALADDFKTINGKEYKNATVTHVEADGITVKFSGGIAKIPFGELPQELKDKYHYDPEAAQRFAAETAARIKTTNEAMAAEQLRQKAATHLLQITVVAIIEVKEYGKWQTIADIQEMSNVTGEWAKVGKKFRGTIDDPMPETFDQGTQPVVTLYRIGHTNDTYRGPLLTTSKEKAINFLIGEGVGNHR